MVSMKQTLLFFFYLLTLLPLSAEDIVMAQGTSTTLPLPAKALVRLEKTPTLKVQTENNSLRIVAKTKGYATLHIGSKLYSIFVCDKNKYNTYVKLQKWVLQKRGPFISVENGQFIINGKFLVFTDWLDLRLMMGELDSFQIRAAATPEIQDQIQNHLKKVLAENNLGLSHLSFEPSWTLRLAQGQSSELKSYQQLLNPLGVNVSLSSAAIQTIPLVEVSVIAAEIQRTEMSRLGISWPTATTLQVLPQFNSPATSLIATINHLEESGKGRILAKPTLISQSGEIATFHSGGEFAIKAMNQFQSSVVWKKYGLILQIKPRADHRGKIDMQIDFEFSSLDTREDSSGVPGLIIHRVTSHVNIEKSKTIALSGLIKDEWKQTRKGLPGLSKIPIFYPLFASEEFQNNQSELVFFVTPRVVNE